MLVSGCDRNILGTLDAYICGFNVAEISENNIHEAWQNGTVANKVRNCKHIALSWESFFSLDSEGQVAENGQQISLEVDIQKSSIVMLAAAEERLAVLTVAGQVALRTQKRWRHLRLQSDGVRPAGTICHLSVGRSTLAACDTEGSLLTMEGVPTPPGERLQAVACGREHVILLTHSGRVYCYGGGSRGQLGSGGLEPASEPRLVRPLDGVPVRQVAAGGWHSVAVSRAGDLYVWGWNQAGQLGLPLEEEGVVAEPRLLPLQLDVREAACGTRHTVALLEDGSVLGWGWNGHGQLAAPPEGEACLPPRPLQLPAKPVIGVAAGGWKSALLVAADTASDAQT